MCLPMCAHWHHLANTIEPVLPSAHPSSQSKQQIDPFSRSCTAHGTYNGLFSPPQKKIAYCHGDLDPHLIHGSLAHPSPQPKRHLDRLSRFCIDDRRMPQSFTTGRPSPSKVPLPIGDLDPIYYIWFPWPTRMLTQTASRSIKSFLGIDNRRVSLYFTMERPFPPSKLALPMGDLDPSNTWFPGPTRVLNPNGISIGSAVFAELTSVTDPTDRPHYSVGNNRPHLRT